MSTTTDFDVTIRNGRICTANETYYADIGIKDGVIATIAKNLPAGKKDINAQGRWVLPGGIDSHCHVEQLSGMGMMCADDFYSATVSAAFGGTTTIVPFAAQHRGNQIPEVVADYSKRAAEKAVIDYGFHLILSDPTPEALEKHLPAVIKDGITSFKIYMTYDRMKLDDYQVLDVLECAGEEGALVKRDWWKRWESDRAPPCEFIIQSWDTAFTKSQRADYSACTTWGVFHKDENESDVNIILLDAWKDKLEFPELKAKAKEMYDEWQPDSCIIEAKAAGAPLIFELRRMGVYVQDYTPTRGNDKFVRLNSVTDLFSSGKVWAPETRWADEVIEEMARFPNAEHDDLVDSTVQALMRFRQGGFLRLDSDEEDDPIEFRRKRVYY